MLITIEEVDKCRYVTAGDYFMDDGNVRIQVMRQTDPRHSFLIKFHEFYEQFATSFDGLTEPQILAHDLANPDADEPGELPNSPYRKRHLEAELLERIAANFLGVDWKEYERTIIISQ